MQVTHQQLREITYFEEVFSSYAPRIYRYAVVQLRSKEDAEEVASQTFIRLWDYVNRREGTIEHLAAFLYRIAKHCLIDLARRRRPSISIEEMIEGGHDVSDPKGTIDTDALDRSVRIERGLQVLAATDRDLLIWRFIEGIPVHERC
jgi:RNA polymerase sigma-70 factor (ECF subfamily)